MSVRIPIIRLLQIQLKNDKKTQDLKMLSLLWRSRIYLCKILSKYAAFLIEIYRGILSYLKCVSKVISFTFSIFFKGIFFDLPHIPKSVYVRPKYNSMLSV